MLVIQETSFTGLKSTLWEWLILLAFKWETVHKWAGLIIEWETSTEWKMQVPDIDDIQLCGLHMSCRIVETLCLAHLLTFITFTGGFYLLLFIWGSKSFPERTALILTCLWWCSALHWTDGGLWSPVDAASFPTADVSGNQKPNSGLWIITSPFSLSD